MMKRSEYRRAARKLLNAPGAYSYLAGTRLTLAGEAVILNLSERGALIRTKVPLQVRTDDVMDITLSLDEAKVTVEGRIARVVPQANGSCDIGVAFRNLSAEDEYLLALELTKKAL